MKCKVLVFGGTTEGRVLSDYLKDAGIDHEVSVATEYGKDILLENGEENLLVGRKNADEIIKHILSAGVSIVVDATHPFATAVSKEIRKACSEAKVRYIRLKRDTGKVRTDNKSIIYVDSIQDAVKRLSEIEGKIFILTGSKDIEEIAALVSDTSRLFVRVLPNVESIQKCIRAGLSGKQIIAMQGPFSRQLNISMIKEIGASAILTKESGKTGGFQEKLDAAIECGIKAIVLKNPENEMIKDNSYNLEEVLKVLSEHTGKKITDQKIITLAGIGPGSEKYYTREVSSALKNADIIFGAQSVLKNVNVSGKRTVPEYQGEKIFDFLKENPEFVHPLVVFSGDISLCSGAKKASSFFNKKGYLVNRIAGISSVTLFAQRLGLSLENVRILSAHGRECNVYGAVLANPESIILPSDESHCIEICKELLQLAENNASDDLEIVVGCLLGTDKEKLIWIKYTGSDKNDKDALNEIEGKCLIYVKNRLAYSTPVITGICDEQIIRGRVPMTKEEIRTLSMRKLSLTRSAVLYDIGAGTGSISLEAGLLSSEIKVYSIEKNPDAIALLRHNKEKFHAGNIEIIEGNAKDKLSELPVPSHVFIGGSGGELKVILKTVFEKNENARVVINTVTAETFAEVIECLKDYSELEPDIIQVFVSRFKKAGNYHLSDALNPVYIITLQKGAVYD